MSPSKRPGIEVAPGAVVCVEAKLTGDIKIGTKTIIHPSAKISATNGPIIIGESNIIEECVIIENKSKEVMVIGNNNVFEVGAEVYAKSIGDNNVFESKSYVGENMQIGIGCSFGVRTKVNKSTTIPDNSVFFGEPLNVRISGEKPSVQTAQIEFLSKILSNYHHLVNPTTYDFQLEGQHK